MSARAPAPLSVTEVQLFALALQEFTAHAGELLDAMVAAAISAAPVLGGDPSLEASVRASVRAMTARWSESQRREPGRRVPADIPPEAVDVARDLVRHGVDLQHLHMGYRHAENAGCRAWVAAAASAVPAADLAAIVDHGLASINEWVGSALLSITRQVEQERDELMGGERARRLETITLVLDGAPISEQTARERLRYDLAATHTALVLWAPSDQHAAPESTARLIAIRAGLRPPLTLAVNTTTAWAWFSTESPLDVRRMEEIVSDVDTGVVVTAGSSRPGMAGFRRSHREATATRRIVENRGTSGSFTSYTDVDVAVLSSLDREAAGEFVADALGALALADPTLRDTVRIYLQEDGNAARAAARLFTHRNTVLNRLERAEQLLPIPLSGHHLRVGLALELTRWIT